jgi:hypothetical protein
LYLLDAAFFNGYYFNAMIKMISDLYTHF